MSMLLCLFTGIYGKKVKWYSANPSCLTLSKFLCHLTMVNCKLTSGELLVNTRAFLYYVSGIYIINLGKTLEKLELAARVIAAIENPKDIIVLSARSYGQRAVHKFAQYTGVHAIAGRHTPGTFTNQLQTSFSEPRLLILTDPRTDHQVNLSVKPVYVGQFVNSECSYIFFIKLCTAH